MLQLTGPVAGALTFGDAHLPKLSGSHYFSEYSAVDLTKGLYVN